MSSASTTRLARDIRASINQDRPGGLSIVWSPANRAYLVMWMSSQILHVRNDLMDALEDVYELTGHEYGYSRAYRG